MSKISIKHLNNEHNDWLKSLQFYKDQVMILKGRLTELAGKYTSGDVVNQLDHFENQFNIQITNIDTISHDLKAYLHDVTLQAEGNNGYVEKELIDQHNSFRARFIEEEKFIHELRHEFNKFASHWM